MKGGLVDKVQVEGDASIGHSRTDLNGTVHDDYVSAVVKDAVANKSEYSSATYNQSALNNDHIAGTENDAAYVNWGGKWQMPTQAQYEELFDSNNCYHAYVLIDNVWCYRLTSKTTGQVLYLPSVGRYNGTSIDCSSDVRYWTDTRRNNTQAYFAYCYSNSYYSTSYQDRYYGLNIRAIRRP